MKMIGRLLAMCASMLLPGVAHAADDPFLGTWHLSKQKSIIAKDPGVKSKEFVFAPTAQGVLITETYETTTENGKKHVSHLPYTYGKLVPQTEPGYQSLLVVKTDNRTAYWTAGAKGEIAAQLQAVVSDDGKRMTFRYLWSAADPDGKAAGDRYVYERE